MRGYEYQRVSVSRIEEHAGWLGVVQRDPGEDPPDMAGVRLPPLERRVEVGR